METHEDKINRFSDSLFDSSLTTIELIYSV